MIYILGLPAMSTTAAPSTPKPAAAAPAAPAAPAAASASTTPPAQPTRSYGNLKDSDRIFTNIYGQSDIWIEGALKRVRFISLPSACPRHHTYLRFI